MATPAKRESNKRYGKTAKGKVVRKRINASPNVRAAIKRWRESDHGKAMTKAAHERRKPRRSQLAKRPEVALKHWQWSIKKRYGLTPAEYQAMLEAQHGLCAICRQLPKKKRLHVDHNHANGKVRGLLCNNCNRTLGFWNDDPQRFRVAAQYLERIAS